MATQLNPAGERFASSLIGQGKVNRSASWSWSAADEDAILGKDEDWTAYSKHFLAVESGTDPKTKQHFKYPFAKGDTIYRSALMAIRQRAGQQNATAIFQAAGRLIGECDRGNKKMNAAEVTLNFAASFISSQTPEQPSGIQGVAYSGGVIPGYGALGDCIIDLSGVQFSPSIFMLVNHDPNQRAGRATLSVADQQLQVAGQFSQATPTGQQIAAEFAEGAPFQFSVGIAANLEYSPDKMTRTVNGQAVTVNSIFSNPRVLEVSLVPAGADPHTSAAAFSATADIDPPSADDDTMTTTHDPVIDRLTAENEALTKQLTALQAQVKAIRTREVDELFEALGTTLSAEERQQFISLSAETFAAVAARLREKAKPTAPTHLFSVQTAGKEGMTTNQVQMPSTTEIYEKRRQAAKARGAA